MICDDLDPIAPKNDQQRNSQDGFSGPVPQNYRGTAAGVPARETTTWWFLLA